MNENQNGLQPEEVLNAEETAAQACSCTEQAEDTTAADQPAEGIAAPAEEACEGEGISFTVEPEEGAEPLAPSEPVQPKKNVKLTIALAAVVAVLAIAAIFLASALKTKPIVHENELGYTSYTMTEEQATDKVLSQVVAVCADDSLTNRVLPYYYWEQYYNFVNQYGQYLSYILDTTLGLDEQLYDDANTWQQQFLDAAIRRFGMVSAVCSAAEADGYVLDADTEAQITAVRENLESAAQTYGFENTDEIVRDAFGPTATIEEYMTFIHDSMTATGYLNTLVEKIEYTLDDLSTYYDEHAADYEAQYVLKVDKPMMNVRHILIQPTETNEDGSFTDAAWDAAKEEADRIYAEWEDSDRSEDSFAALAQEYSVDGSSVNGGLYENVYPGQMVTEFNDWCFDDARKVGDYGMVKTRFGYHIMFYSGVGEEIYWPTVVKEDYLNDQASLLLDEICARYPVTSTIENAALLPLPEQSSADASAAE